MLDRDHPYFFLAGFAKQHSLLLNFSKYKYTPDTILDDRHSFQKLAADIDEESISNLIDNLSCDEELAIHSNYYIPRGKRSFRVEKLHIPMIDFCIPEWNLTIKNRLQHCLPDKIYKELLIFRSGRSFHGYSLCGINSGEWLDFMGRLLLVNPPGEAYIDNRWVGHRLMSGYAALRWSARTSNYLDAPRFFGHIQQLI